MCFQREETMQAFGSAVATLFDADIDDVAIACTSSSDEPESGVVACSALSSIVAFLSPDHEDGARSRCWRFVELLLDRCASRRSDRQQRRVGLLLRWILTHPSLAEPGVLVLADCLRGEASLNRLKLGGAWALQAACTCRFAASGSEWSPSVSVRLVQALSACLRAGHDDGGPTKLMVAIADATACVFSETCRCATQAIASASKAPWTDAMRQCVADVRALLKILARWRASQCAFVAALEELSRELCLMAGGAIDNATADAKRSSVHSAARMWRDCAPLLLCGTEPPSRQVCALVDHAGQVDPLSPAPRGRPSSSTPRAPAPIHVHMDMAWHAHIAYAHAHAHATLECFCGPIVLTMVHAAVFGSSRAEGTRSHPAMASTSLLT